MRCDISPVLALDLDYRYLAMTEATFRIPDTGLHYRSGDNTNNFVAFGPLPTDPLASPEPRVP